MKLFKMNFIVSIIVYKQDNPEHLQYCPVCRKYKAMDEFTTYLKICDSCKRKNNDLTMSKINKIVANYYQISVEDMLKRDRHREFVKARQICMYFGKLLTDLSDRLIGENVGGRDRGTVIHSFKTVKNDRKNKSYNRELRKLEKSIIKN